MSGLNRAPSENLPEALALASAIQLGQHVNSLLMRRWAVARAGDAMAFTTRKYPEPFVRVYMRRIDARMKMPSRQRTMEGVRRALSDKVLGGAMRGHFEREQESLRLEYDLSHQVPQFAGRERQHLDEVARVNLQNAARLNANEARGIVSRNWNRSDVLQQNANATSGVSRQAQAIERERDQLELARKRLTDISALSQDAGSRFKARRAEYDAWGESDVRVLQLSGQAEVQKHQLEFAALFVNWSAYYNAVFDAAIEAFRKVNETVGAYVEQTQARRERYVKVFTTLIGVGLSVVGLGGLAKQLEDVLVGGMNLLCGEDATQLIQEGIAFAIENDIAGTKKLQELDEAKIKDEGAKACADLVEEKLHNKQLPQLREQFSKNHTFAATEQWLNELRGKLFDELHTMEQQVIAAVRTAGEIPRAHAEAVLELMIGDSRYYEQVRIGAHSVSLARLRSNVMDDSKAFYADWATVAMKGVYERHECPSNLGPSVYGGLKEAMEKWAWAMLITQSEDSAISDMANMYGGVFGTEESALMQRFKVIGIATRRETRGAEDESARAQTLATAAAGGRFTTGLGHVGPNAIRALKAWSNFYLRKSPLQHALGK